MKKIMIICVVLVGTYLQRTNAVSESTKSASDSKETFAQVMKAAKANNVQAQYDVCDFYFTGIGVPQSYDEAFQWCYKAALRDHAAAQAYIGHMYSQGDGVAVDQNKSVEWLRKGADLGNGTAQFSLGVKYCYNNQVVPLRYEVCYALLSVAMQNGEHALAEAARNMHEKAMSEREINMGKNLAKEMEKPKNVLNALDQFESTHPLIKK
jgi:uncharacterized protein